MTGAAPARDPGLYHYSPLVDRPPIGWPDGAVHQYFFDALQDDGTGINALAAHVEAAAELFSPTQKERLRATVGRLYLSSDWRDAARARRLVRALDTERSVPILVEALSLWHRREAEGEGSRRIVAEQVRKVEKIETAVEPRFQEHFVSSMSIPNGEESASPSQRKRRGRRGARSRS